MTVQGDPEAPSCPECASGDVEQIERGTDPAYRCLNCGTEFDPAGNRFD